MDFGGEFFDGRDSGFDLMRDLRCRRQARVAQPIVADHPIFIRVGESAFFELSHLFETSTNPGGHGSDPILSEVHSTEIDREFDLWEFAIIFFEPFPELLFRINHNGEERVALKWKGTKGEEGGASGAACVLLRMT